MGKRLAFPLAAIFLGLITPLLAAEVALRFFPVHTGIRMSPVNDADPVAHYEPNHLFTFSKGWSFALVEAGWTNNAGYVNDQDYASEGIRPLIAVIGDSYIGAAMIAHWDTLQGRLEDRLAGKARVYSYGVGGAPLSQYLAFARHASEVYSPDAFLFVIVGNDFDESLVAYVAKQGFHQFERAPDNSLQLVRTDYEPSLQRRIARHSALARYLLLNLESGRLKALLRGAGSKFVGNTEAAATPERIADAKSAINTFFDHLSEATGVPPARVLFLVDGMRPNLYSSIALRRAEHSYMGEMRRAFFTAAIDYGAHVIDLQPWFIDEHKATGVRFEFEVDHHWSADGHRIAAVVSLESQWLQSLMGDQFEWLD